MDANFISVRQQVITVIGMTTSKVFLRVNFPLNYVSFFDNYFNGKATVIDRKVNDYLDLHIF